MDDLALLQAKIPQFPGYGEQEARRRSDGLVRSYLGEALASLQARFGGEGVAVAIEELVLRAGFMNQSAFHQFEYADSDAAQIASIAAGDVRLVALADDAPSITVEHLAEYLASVGAAFDARDRTMENAQA